MTAASSYGKDISATTELRTGRYATGVRLVAEAVFRRLTTPRGMLRGDEEEQNYGLDLTELIGSVSTSSDAAALGGRIRSELKKDERLERVDVVVTASSNRVAKTFLIQIACVTTEGPFELQVSVGEVTVELLGIKVET